MKKVNFTSSKLATIRQPELRQGREIAVTLDRVLRWISQNASLDFLDRCDRKRHDRPNGL